MPMPTNWPPLVELDSPERSPAPGHNIGVVRTTTRVCVHEAQLSPRIGTIKGDDPRATPAGRTAHRITS